MIDKWFQNDINKVLAVHDRVVVTDALGEGRFLLDYLPSDVVVINTGNEEIDEIEARYRAEKDCVGKKVVFYKQNTPDSLCFLLEYAETYGCIVLDDMEAYIRKHLFEGIKENTELGKQELLMAAKLSKGKDCCIILKRLKRIWMEMYGRSLNLKFIALSQNHRQNSRWKYWHSR